jgi:uncharacterized protein (DUF342 family)
MFEFEAVDMKTAFETLENKYGINWHEHYYIETEIKEDTFIKVTVNEVSNNDMPLKWDDVNQIISKELILDDKEVDTVVDEIMEAYNEIEITVEISEDEMKASVDIKPGSLKDRIKKKDIYDLFQQENIVFGIKDDVIDTLCQTEITHLISSLIVAEGRFPTSSKDSQIEFKFPKNGYIENSEKPDSKIDYAKRKKIFQCKKGDILVRKSPGVQGIDGTTVTGNKIISEKFKDINLRQLIGNPNTLNLSEDKNVIQALYPGQAYLSDFGKIHIRKIFIVNETLDYSVGDIEFDGSVIIHGDVELPFEVHAKGDIYIEGVVRNTVITSEGSIFIKGGVSGNGNAKIECKKDFTSYFLSNVTIITDGNCISRDYILNSNVYAGDNIVVHGRGTVTGGALFAENNISVKTAGSLGGVKTHLAVGMNHDKMKENYKNNLRISAVLEKIKELTTADSKILEQIKKIDTDIKRQQLTRLLAKVRLAKKKYFDLIKKFQNQKIKTIRKNKQFIPKIIISKYVFLGVVIQIYNEKVKLPAELGPTEFTYLFEKKQIGAKPIGKWEM